jgi:hypothetical protein
VKANRGAAGVDGESLEAFEKDLKGNLYKIWNRMLSGSFFEARHSWGLRGVRGIVTMENLNGHEAGNGGYSQVDTCR